MNEVIILGAKYLYLVSVIIIAVYLVRAPSPIKKSLLVKVMVSGLIAGMLAKLAGHVWYDARPFVSDHVTPLIPHAADNGFPSDHTLLTSLLGFVTLIFSRWLGFVLLIIAALVGWARVAAGVHHGIDILGAFVISAASVGLVTVAYRLIKQPNKETEES